MVAAELKSTVYVCTDVQKAAKAEIIKMKSTTVKSFYYTSKGVKTEAEQTIERPSYIDLVNDYETDYFKAYYMTNQLSTNIYYSNKEIQ